MAKKSGTVRYTAKQIASKLARGEGRDGHPRRLQIINDRARSSVTARGKI